MAERDQPTQPTQPKGIDPKTGKPYEPAEIPVPTHEQFMRDLRKVSEPDRAGGQQGDD